MNRFLFLLPLISLLFAGQALRAQTVPDWQPGELSRKGARIAVQGVKLDKDGTLMLLEQAGGPDLSGAWQRYASQRGWGIGLTAGGFTTAVVGTGYTLVYITAGAVGTMFAAVGGDEAVQSLWDQLGPRASAGLVVAGAGLVAGVTGIVLLVNGNTHLKRIVSTCNETGAPAAELTFGATPHGIGLALRF